VIDTKQATCNITSSAVYGNSLVKTAAIEKLLQSYIGVGKSYSDLLSAKQQVNKLYRDMGHAMVAVSMPARIFGETIPVRIYEAKQRH